MRDSWSDSKYSDCCLHQLFETRVEMSPQGIAILYGGRSITFTDLNCCANRLANYLQRAGIGPESFVGVFLKRTPAAVVALLAILKAGGAYVPLDPRYPPERLAEILDELKSPLVVTDSAMKGMLPAGNSLIVCLDALWSALKSESSENIDSGVTLINAAYVMYTSGSSGKPKGVIRIHRGLLNHFPWADFSSDDICSLNLPLSVGFSVHRLFSPLVCGIPIAVLPDRLVNDPRAFVAGLEAARVTNAAFVPSMLTQIVDLGSSISSRLTCLRTITVGGSSVPLDLIGAFRELVPQARIFNQYASTEMGPIAFGELTDSTDPKSLLGLEVVHNTEIYILGANGLPVNVGDKGELYVAGPQIARGYVQDPVQTKDRFVHVMGTRAYRTGDLACLLPTGKIEVLGRVDNQVKIRGFRVEIEEVESVLRTHSSLKDIAVATQETKGERQLVAYLVTKPGKQVTVAEMRFHAARHLPNYMVPAKFYAIEALPYTISGKLDRVALPMLDSTRVDLSSPYGAPRTQIESMIIEVLSDLLHVSSIGILDRFDELGGDSMTAVQLILRVRQMCGVDLPLDLITNANIAELCDWLSKSSQGRRNDLGVRGHLAPNSILPS